MAGMSNWHGAALCVERIEFTLLVPPELKGSVIAWQSWAVQVASAKWH